MGYSEFPHSNYEQQDLSEFIHIYKKLLDNYSGTLKKITDLDKRLTDYEADVLNRINNLQTVVIPHAIQVAITNEMTKYQNDLGNIRESIAKNSSDIINLDNRVTRVNASLMVRIAELETALRVEMQSLETRITENIEQLSSTVENYRTVLEQNIDDLRTEMLIRNAADVKQSKDYTDSKVSDIMRIINQMKLEIDKASIKWIWDNGCNFGGYDAFQWYMDVTPTAQEWHDRHFDCVDWYVRGREVFHWFDRRTYMFSPFTGRLCDPRKIIEEIVLALKNKALTAEEYEELKITAEEYENKKVTALDYDWYGKEIFN